MKSTTLFVGVVAVVATSACRTPQPVSTLRAGEDENVILEEVRAALKEGGCLGCHSESGPSEFRQWALDTKNTVERLRSQEADADFNPKTFGAKGAYKAYPEYFKRFYDNDDAFQAFADALRPDPGMRVKGTGDKQKQRFEAIRDSMVKLAAFVGGSANQCVTKISAPLRAHLKEMETSGWAAKLLTGDNSGRSFQSYGCPADTVDPLKCLADTVKFKPTPELLASDLGVPGTRMVQVANVGSTFYWTRSSPDGRFVGNGGQGNDAHVDDIQESIRYYIADKSYDPGFFPDNSGFTIHGNPAIFCSMEVLRPDDQRNPSGTDTIGGKEWKTVTIDPEAPHNKALCLVDRGGATTPAGDHAEGDFVIPTYQSVGSGQGTRAYVLTGAHETDAGDVRTDSNLSFSGDLSIFELRRNAAGGYDRVSNAPTEFRVPGEGDYSLTPSTQYIVGRVAGLDENNEGKQLGYRLRSLANMMSKGSAYDKDADDTVSSVCLEGSGSKPLASLDERFLTFHQYNPDKDSSDIFVIDLMQEGRVYKVTNVPNGRQALFAHFRADGWLYYLLAQGGGFSSADAYIIATDVAIRIAEGGSGAGGPADDLESVPVPNTTQPGQPRPGQPRPGQGQPRPSRP